MTPSELKQQTLVAVRDVQRVLRSPGFLLKTRNLSASTERRIGQLMFESRMLDLHLDNEALGDIRERLKDNEPELLKAIRQLRKAKRKLEKTEENLRAAETLFSIVGRLVAL